MPYLRNCLFGTVIALILSGCAAYISQPMAVKDARLGPVTGEYDELKNLPEPLEPIPVAVYKFRDQTGQYKPSELGNNWSTAITQGATTILNRVLGESGWFTPIERENLSNLLNERKIIRSSREQYNDPTPLPPLLFAGIILEGGVISYETNILTGGAGLRYFGMGASGQYREDRITVYLRAVSTKNGRILKTVYTSKTILSQMVDVGVFRYVEFQRLLEAETGFTYNEPTEMAVTAAIEKAVQSLIIEGVLDGYWSLKNPADLSSDVIVNYLNEKRENIEIDHLGRKLVERRDSWQAGVHVGSHVYTGDYPGARPQAIGGATLGGRLSDHTSLLAQLSHGNLRTTNFVDGNYTSADLILHVRFLPYDRFTPFITLGGGVLAEHRNALESIAAPRYFPKVSGQFGGEYMVTPRFGVQASVLYNYLFTDNLDGLERGLLNDAYWGAQIGTMWYFNLKGKKKEDPNAGQVPDLPDLQENN